MGGNKGGFNLGKRVDYTKEAARCVRLYEFIKSIIDRFYTMINEGGTPEQCASKKWKQGGRKRKVTIEPG